jgi:hypothetical protein
MRLLISIILGIVLALLIVRSASSFAVPNLAFTAAPFDMNEEQEEPKKNSTKIVSKIVSTITGNSISEDKLYDLMTASPSPAPRPSSHGVVLPAPTPEMNRVMAVAPPPQSVLAAIGASPVPPPAVAIANSVADGTAAGATSLDELNGGALATGQGGNLGSPQQSQIVNITGASVPFSASGGLGDTATPPAFVSVLGPAPAPASAPVMGSAPSAPAALTEKQTLLNEIGYILKYVH